MKITKLFSQHTEGTQGLTDNTTINVDTPVEINGRTAYRRTYYLRFTFDDYANGIRIKPTTSKLKARFDEYYLHLNSDNEAFQTQPWQVEDEDTLVKLHLTHPWRLTKVRTWDARGIDVLRLDGDAVSEEPTIKANANFTIAAEFVGQDFALRKKPVYRASDITQAEDFSEQTVTKHAIQKGKGTKGDKVMALVGDATDGVSLDDISHDDMAFETDAVESIPAHGIKWVQLKSVPTGPRIAIGSVNQSIEEQSEVTSLWNEPGQHNDTPVWLPQSRCEAVLAQVQTALDRYIAQQVEAGDAVADTLYLPLTIESDTPAKFRFSDLEIHYSLLKNQWDHWSESQKQAGKETIAFDGSALKNLALALSFPPDAQVDKAVIHFGTDVSSSSGFAANTFTTDLNQAKGIQVVQGTTAASRLEMTQAKLVNRAAIALYPVTDKADIQVCLRSDQNGKPQGAVLTEAGLTIDKLDGRQWIFAAFAEDVLLDAKNYWLTVGCAEGAVVWLADDEPGHSFFEASGSGKRIDQFTLLWELGLSLPAGVTESVNNIAMRFDTNLVSITGEQLDATAQFTPTIPQMINLVVGEQGEVTIYQPEIEYS